MKEIILGCVCGQNAEAMKEYLCSFGGKNLMENIRLGAKQGRGKLNTKTEV